MAKITDKIKSFHPGDYVNMRVFLTVMLSFLMLALIISASIVLVSLRNRKKAEESVREHSSFASSLDSSLDILRTGDFIFPEQENLKRSQPYLQREHQKNWSRDEVDRYWIEPVDTGIGEISDYNRSLVEDMLDEVP